MSFTKDELVSWGVIQAEEVREETTSEETTVETNTEANQEEVKEEVVETVQETVATQEETKTEEVVEEQVEPEIELEFSDDLSKDFYTSIESGDLAKAYDILNGVMEYKRLAPEDLAMKYLQELNPELSEDEIMFEMAEQFGVGLDELTQDQRDLMSESEIEAYEKNRKKQAIAFKKLTKEAGKHYEELSKEFKLELPKTKVNIKQKETPVDPEYVAYKESINQAEESSKAWKDMVDTGIKEFSGEVAIPLEFEINDGKVAFESKFKLSEQERKAVYEEVLTRVASPYEQKLFVSEDGKVNLQGYMAHVAKTMYADKIATSIAKEAATATLERFIEKEIKNSTVGTNGQATPVDRGRTIEQELMDRALNY